MSRRSSSARSSRYHPPQGSFLLRVLREVFDPYKKSMLVLDSSAVEWSRPCRTTRSRSEEHTSELQSLMRISYAVLCLKKKTQQLYTENSDNTHRRHNH